MSTRIRGLTASLLAAGVLASCSGPDFVSFHPDPSRVPDPPGSIGSSLPPDPTVGPPTPSATPIASVPPAVVESPEVTPKPSGEASSKGPVTPGEASTYGGSKFDGLFALPSWYAPRGTTVEVCALEFTNRCVIRTSNDVGPKKSTGRIADLDAPTFNHLCACDWHVHGVMDVTVEIIDD